ncbi:MAG: DUF5050 domain-containing protein [Bacillota bacterium]|jgi:hypothetical protein
MKLLGRIFLIFAITLIFFGQAFAEENWDFKVSLLEHQVVLKINSGTGLYDGKPLVTSSPILKDGRIYIPLRLLRDTGMAEIIWHPQQKCAEVIIAKQNVHVRYQANKPLVSFMGSNGLGEIIEMYKINNPAPFLKNNLFYIPVKSFEQALGKNITYANKTLTISWSIPLIERNSFPMKTDQDTQELNVLYQEGLEVPLIMLPADIGSACSIEAQKKGELLIDGKKFRQIQISLPLQPGENPFYLWVRKGSLNLEEPFSIKREVAEGSLVLINYFDQVLGDVNIREIFEITEPERGYVKLPAPAKMNIKGELKKESFGDNIFRLRVGKLVKGKYQELSNMELPVVNGQFAGGAELSEPGSYLLEIISPKYIPYIEHGPLGTKWAEIRVEVVELAIGEVRGNTPGNLNNNGLFAKAGDWIYYSNLIDQGKLYKMKADGTEVTKITDDYAWYI